MKIPSTNDGFGVVPLTVGVVGHRGIAVRDIERVRSQMREILTFYRRQYPVTPIFLFTALAEGADQIAAEVGLDIEEVYVVAILPMPPREYEKDFATEEKVLKFRSLLNSCYQVVEAQTADANTRENVNLNFSSESFFETVAGRDMAYRDCGRFISQQSHVLIAAWDGEFSTSVAGTADTISHRLKPSERVPLPGEEIYLWPQEDGILFHIPTRRVESEQKDQSEEHLDQQLKIRMLDADFVSRTWIPDASDRTADNLEWLNKLLVKRGTSEEPTWLLSKSIEEVSDAQATRMQSRFRFLSSSLLILGVFSLFLLDLQHTLSPIWPYFASLISLCILGALWMKFVRGNLKDRFYQLRTLAEGMRVQTVWIECGVAGSASDDYLKGIPDVSWIPRTMRSALFVDNLKRPVLNEDMNSQHGNPEKVAKDWLTGQIAYFGGTKSSKGAIRGSREKYRRYDRLSLGGIAIALICILGDGWRFLPTGIHFPDWATESDQVIMHLGLSISAASIAYSQLMAFREIARQYEISQQIFKRGTEIIEHESPVKLSNKEHLSAIVAQVGREALRETSTWLALKRDRAVHPL